jgi:phage replication O-like protein O
MASPQLDNGKFIRLSNEIIDNFFIKIRLSGNEHLVLWVVIRKTWGFNRKEAEIPLNIFIEMTGLQKVNVCRSIRQLINKKIIAKNGKGKNARYSFLKDYEQYTVNSLSKTITNNLLSKMITNTDNSQKLNNRDDDSLSKMITNTAKKKKENLLSKMITNVIKIDNRLRRQPAPTVHLQKPKYNIKDNTNKKEEIVERGKISSKRSPDLVKTKKNFDEESEEYKLAKLLQDLILERRPTCKKENLSSWAEHIDKMIRLDNRSIAEIEEIIHWCQQDSFWQNNILSTNKLRKQFDQMALKMGQSKKKNMHKSFEEIWEKRKKQLQAMGIKNIPGENE